MSEIQQVINKVMSDANFRCALVENPFDALHQEGVEPSSAMLTSFEGLQNTDLENLDINWDASC